MKRPVVGVLVAAWLVVAPAIGAAQSRSWTPRPMPYGPAAEERPRPRFASATDLVAGVMALPPLSQVALRDGAEELRIWIGFGIVMPHELLRLTRTKAGVSGELVYWWESRQHPSMDTTFASFLADMRRAAGRNGCSEANTGTKWVLHRPDGNTVEARGWVFACRIDLGEAAPDWAAFRARLRELGAFDLPDPGTLSPEEVMVLDGISIEVEVLHGRSYHTYTYSNPDVQPWPEAKTAAKIIELVRTLEVDRRR